MKKNYILLLIVYLLSNNINAQTSPFIKYNGDTLFVQAADNATSVAWNNGKKVTSYSKTNGIVNTDKIVTMQNTGTTAAQVCADLVADGYSNWYLPSKNELNYLYTNKGSVGGFTSNYYWSSTEDVNDTTKAFVQQFGNGSTTTLAKTQTTAKVRCVRKKTPSYSLNIRHNFWITSGGINYNVNDFKKDPNQRNERSNTVNVFDLASVGYVLDNVDEVRDERCVYRLLASSDTIPDSSDFVWGYRQYQIDGGSTSVGAGNPDKSDLKVRCNMFPPYRNGYLLFEIKSLDFPSSYLKNNVKYKKITFDQHNQTSDVDIIVGNLNGGYIASGSTYNNTVLSMRNNSGLYSSYYQPYNLYCGTTLNFYLSKQSFFNIDSSLLVSQNKNICYPSNQFEQYNANEICMNGNFNGNGPPNNSLDSLVYAYNSFGLDKSLNQYPLTFPSNVSSGSYYLYVVPQTYIDPVNKGCISYSSSTNVYVNMPKIILNNNTDTLHIYSEANNTINENISINNQGSASLTWSANASNALVAMPSSTGTVQANNSGYINININTTNLPIGDSVCTISVNSNDPLNPLKKVVVKLHIINPADNIQLSVDYNLLCSQKKLLFQKTIPLKFASYASSCNYVVEWSDNSGTFAASPPKNSMSCSSSPTKVSLNNLYDLSKSYKTRIKLTGPVIIYGSVLPINKRKPVTPVSASACTIYTSPSKKHQWNSSGVYNDTLISHNGCDSIVNITLTINKTTYDTISNTNCDRLNSPSGKHIWKSSGRYNDTIQNTKSCDSVITVNLTIKNSTIATVSVSACDSYISVSRKYIWNQSGIYNDTIANSVGCDSIIITNVTIKKSYATINPVSCNNYISPSGKIWTTSNTYLDTIPNATGCDSIITLNLTIKNGSDTSFIASACNSYTSPSGKIYTISGTYSDTILNAAGCDSIITVNLTIKNSTTGTDAITAFDSYTWINGKTYTTSNNVAKDTLTNAVGCDSIVTLNLTIKNSSTGIDSITACDSYTWINGTTYTTNNNTAKDTLVNVSGCDSIVTLSLTIKNSTTGVDVITACNSYTWINGITYTTSNTTAKDTIRNASGCDSIITLNLTINTVDVTTTVNQSNISANNTSAIGYQWINCDNNSLITGETNRTYFPSVSGNYAVALTSNGCLDTSACSPVNVTCFAKYTTSYDSNKNEFTLTLDSTTSAMATAYNWNFGDGATSTLSTPSHTFAADTTYNVCLNITTASADTCSYCHVIGKDSQGNIYRLNGFTVNVVNPNAQLTAINLLSQKESGYRVYPNPTSGDVFVVFNQQLNNGSIKIVGVLGQTIESRNNLTGNQFNFNINSHAAGIYFIEVNQNGMITRTKLVKQ
jgi:hypothetical protein